MSKPTMTKSDYEWAKKHMHGGRDFPATIIPDEQIEAVHRRIREGDNPRFILPPDVMRNGQTANDKLQELLQVKGGKQKRVVAQQVVKKATVKPPAKPTVRLKAATVVAAPKQARVRAQKRVGNGGGNAIQTIVVIALVIIVFGLIMQMQGGSNTNPAVPTPSLPGAYLIATLI